MAQEIDVSLSLSLNANSTSLNVPKITHAISQGVLRPNQTTASYSDSIVSLTTTHEALPLGDVTACGYAFFQNLDASNNVQIGTDDAGTFTAFLLLKPGEGQVVRLATNAPFAKAVAATAKLQSCILSD